MTYRARCAGRKGKKGAKRLIPKRYTWSQCRIFIDGVEFVEQVLDFRLTEAQRHHLRQLAL